MHNQHVKIKQQGFTLVEAIITVGITTVLLAIAAPHLTVMIKNNRLSSYINEFAATLYLAKSEAIKRSSPVRVCPSADGASCATSGTWEQGWIVFDDKDNDQTVDTNEDIVYVHKALPNSLVLKGTQFAQGVSYLPNGRISPSLNGSITLCDDRAANDYARKLVLIRTGRFRIEAASSTNHITCPVS